MKMLLLALLLTPLSAHAHTGPDGGFHHTLPFILAWLPFARAMYQAGWRTCLKAMCHWIQGGMS